jgi:acyl-CoA reductase-like NAD-dependent aldehyde dehydrogenase
LAVELFAEKRMPIATINPATGETLKTFDELNEQQLEQKLQLATNAFHTHRTTSFAQRAECLNKAASILETDKAKLGRLMTLEMGKPIKGAIGEVEKCALSADTMPRMASVISRTRLSKQMPPGVMFTFNHWVLYSR